MPVSKAGGAIRAQRELCRGQAPACAGGICLRHRSDCEASSGAPGDLRHIGIRVPTHQLLLATYQTYGVTDDFAVGARRKFDLGEYQFSTRKFIPRVAYAIVLMKRGHETPEPNTADAQEIEKESAEAATLDEPAAYRKKAGFETHLLAAILCVLPKVGPLSMVAVKGPTPAKSFGFAIPGILSLPLYIDPNGGMSNFWYALIGMAISFTVSLVLTLMLNGMIRTHRLRQTLILPK